MERANRDSLIRRIERHLIGTFVAHYGFRPGAIARRFRFNRASSHFEFAPQIKIRHSLPGTF